MLSFAFCLIGRAEWYSPHQLNSMKRFFTSLFVALAACTAFAKSYTGKLVVMVNGETLSNKTASIDVDQQGDGTYKLSLANFSINIGGQEVNVGTINIPATPYTVGNVRLLQANSPVPINGLGNVPINLIAQETADKLNANIAIDFGGMTIKVLFGEGFQVPNSDFEVFGDSKEPKRWHSFQTVTGSFANSAQNESAISSTEKRPGSKGKSSVLIKSRKIDFFFFNIIANGTLTTGRLNAGSSNASNTKNHSFLDLANNDKDTNGDPFYAELIGRPDTLTFWVKFKQGVATPNAPYASANAVITDGTRYQLPEDKTYTNKVAEASTNQIADTKGTWYRYSIPFGYGADNPLEPKAILVTFSTNAKPGEGSGSDELYVDDMELIYNFGIQGILIKDKLLPNFNQDVTEYNYSLANITADDIKVPTLGQGMKVAKKVENGKATILVVSCDLSQYRIYTINITTGINNLPSVENNKEAEIYTLDGVRVNNTNRKGVYIIKDAQGKTRKVVKN